MMTTEKLTRSCCTSRTIRLSTVRRLVARGLATEIRAVRVDGDGFLLEPERYGRAFKLTDAGRVALKGK